AKYYLLDRVHPNGDRYWKRILREKPEQLGWWTPLRAVDSVLTRVPGVRWLAWNTVMWGRQPGTSETKAGSTSMSDSQAIIEPGNIPARPGGTGPNTDIPASSSGTSVFAGAGIFRTVFLFAGMLAMCLVGRIFYALRSFGVDGDLWWHIKNGQSILST